ncbi:farnesyl cysteine-carboxyl methyltransferase [Coemansia sp. RSA 2399]|nr:farnesyl cysteine-carboxyl methyltransferase [Coemansia sp. RSA 2399]
MDERRMANVDAREAAFPPQVGVSSGKQRTPDKWWTPIASLDYSSHLAHNIALTSFALGILAAAGLSTALVGGWSALGILGIYAAFVSLYHMCEYLSVAMYNPLRVSMESFMFQPDGEDGGYALAICVSLVEYAVEWWFYPGLKRPGLVTVIGFAVAAVGQVLRTLAMVTAKVSFNHYVATHRMTDHQLITHGIYKFERHPSYVGFFLWAVGLQVMTKNLVSAALFAMALGFFFCSRTVYEERMLVGFFGEQYQTYRKTTPSLIPVDIWAYVAKIDRKTNE